MYLWESKMLMRLTSKFLCLLYYCDQTQTCLPKQVRHLSFHIFNDISDI